MITKNGKTIGGTRAGAGRKKGFSAITAENARAYVLKRINDELGPLLDTQLEAAKGLSYLTPEGRVFTKLPDTKTGEFLINQTIGKAKESIEVVGDIKLKVDF